MTVAFVAATSSNTNVGVDPSTANTQFVLIAYDDDDGQTDPITATGYTQEINEYAGGDGANTAILYSTSPAAVGGNITVGNPSAVLGLLAFSGVSSSTPFDVTPTFTNAVGAGSGTATWTVVAPSATTVTDGCGVAYAICFDQDGTVSVSSASATGYTQRALGNTGQYSSVVVLTKDTNQATHGALGTVSFTVTLSGAMTGGWVVFTIPLRPAAGGGGGSSISIPTYSSYTTA